MADSLKEFCNFQGKTFEELKAGIAIASTSGAQTAVIKSVSVSSSIATKLVVDGTAVLDVEANSKVTSNEILGSSNTLKLTTDLIPLASGVVTCDSDWIGIVSTDFPQKYHETDAFNVPQAPNATNAHATSVDWLYENKLSKAFKGVAGGAIYVGDRGFSEYGILWSSTGSNAGESITIHEGILYSISTGTIHRYDLESDVALSDISVSGIGVLVDTANYNCCVVDGYLLQVQSTLTLGIFNLATGVGYNYQLSTTSKNDAYIACSKLLDGTYVLCVSSGTYPSVQITEFTDIDNIIGTRRKVSAAGPSGFASGSKNKLFAVQGTYKFLSGGVTEAYIFDASNYTTTVIGNLSGPDLFQHDAIYFSNSAMYKPSIDVRCTGILSEV